jgi:hypothetical protein
MWRMAEGLRAYTLAERPELLAAALAIGGVGEEFAGHDLIGRALAVGRRLRDHWPGYTVVLVDEDRDADRDGDGVVARGCGVPLAIYGEDRPQLPDHGWDAALLWAVEDYLDGREPNVACALDIQVDQSRRGAGLAGHTLTALKWATAQAGLRELVCPLRPPDKAGQPFTPMAEYAARIRNDGLPEDRWLRVHVRNGARIVKVAPFAMVVVEALDRWRAWTGQPFDASGPVVVRGGLAPVVCDLDREIGVYIEPNVWVRHELARLD